MKLNVWKVYIFFCWVNFLNDMYVYFSEKNFWWSCDPRWPPKKTCKNKISLTSMLSYLRCQAIELWLMLYCGEMYNQDTQKISKLSLDFFFTNSFFTIWPNYFQSLSMSPLSTSLCLYLPLSISLSLILDRNHFLVESVTHFTHCHSPYNRKTHYIPHQTHQNGPVDQIRHFGRA